MRASMAVIGVVPCMSVAAEADRVPGSPRVARCAPSRCRDEVSPLGMALKSPLVLTGGGNFSGAVS